MVGLPKVQCVGLLGICWCADYENDHLKCFTVRSVHLIHISKVNWAVSGQFGEATSPCVNCAYTHQSALNM